MRKSMWRGSAKKERVTWKDSPGNASLACTGSEPERGQQEGETRWQRMAQAKKHTYILQRSTGGI